MINLHVFLIMQQVKSIFSNIVTECNYYEKNSHEVSYHNHWLIHVKFRKVLFYVWIEIHFLADVLYLCVITGILPK